MPSLITLACAGLPPAGHPTLRVPDADACFCIHAPYRIVAGPSRVGEVGVLSTTFRLDHKTAPPQGKTVTPEWRASYRIHPQGR